MFFKVVFKILILEKHTGLKGREEIFTNSIAKCFQRHQSWIRFFSKMKIYQKQSRWNDVCLNMFLVNNILISIMWCHK